MPPKVATREVIRVAIPALFLRPLSHLTSNQRDANDTMTMLGTTSLTLGSRRCSCRVHKALHNCCTHYRHRIRNQAGNSTRSHPLRRYNFHTPPHNPKHSSPESLRRRPRKVHCHSSAGHNPRNSSLASRRGRRCCCHTPCHNPGGSSTDLPRKSIPCSIHRHTPNLQSDIGRRLACTRNRFRQVTQSRPHMNDNPSGNSRASRRTLHRTCSLRTSQPRNNPPDTKSRSRSPHMRRCRSNSPSRS